jgi:LPPG:FO 2-phospho-L-lactate transferase
MRPARTVAISPIVGGRALKGPTVEMMLALCGEATPVRVARDYRSLAGRFVLDEVDRGLAPRIERLGYRVLVTDTVMDGVAGARRLAEAVLGDW